MFLLITLSSRLNHPNSIIHNRNKFTYHQTNKQTSKQTGTGRDIKADDFDYDAWMTELHFPGFSAELSLALLQDYNIAG